MIQQLLALQFALLYLPLVFVALGVYGSNFKGSVGLGYLAPLLVIPLLHWLLTRGKLKLTPSYLPQLLLYAGMICAILLYRPLHLHHWDEYSAPQAQLTGLLGILSYLIAYRASCHLQSLSPLSLSGALLSLALCWGLAWYYPLVGFFMLATLFAIGAWVNFDGPRQMNAEKNSELASVIGYSVMLLMLDLSMVVWDYQEVGHWALHFFVAFCGMAVSAFFARSLLFNSVILLSAITNFIYCLLVPAYILNYTHSALAGLGIGALLYYRALNQQGRLIPRTWLTLGHPILWGLLLSFALYHNIPVLGYRWVLAIPLIWLLWRYYKSNVA